MSHFHDEYFEARLNAVQADEDASEAYYRQKEIDAAEEAEYKAMCDADEAAHDWMDAELELMASNGYGNNPEPDFSNWISNYTDPDYLKKAEEAYKVFEEANKALSEAVERLREIGDFKTVKTDAA